MSGTGLAPLGWLNWPSPRPPSGSGSGQWIRASTEGHILVLFQRFLRQDDCVLLLGVTAGVVCGVLVPVPRDAGDADAEHQ